MKKFWGLTRRNLLIYFKDIQAVIFSLMTSIIVFALYLLFLKGTFVDAITDTMGGLEKIISQDTVDMLANTILLSGILGSSSITVAYNCLITVVRDREYKIDYDISATPIKRWQIIISYYLSAMISAFVMTLLISLIGVIVLSIKGELYLGVVGVLKLIAVDLLGAFSSTSFFMIIVMFFNSTSASGAFFGLLSAAAGFIIGAYIPISQFPETIQQICYCFPATGVTALYKNVLMSGLLDSINETIGGLDNGAFVDGMREGFSLEIKMFGNTMSTTNNVMYIGVIMIVCVIAMICIYPKVYKRK